MVKNTGWILKRVTKLVFQVQNALQFNVLTSGVASIAILKQAEVEQYHFSKFGKELLLVLIRWDDSHAFYGRCTTDTNPFIKIGRVKFAKFHTLTS